MSEIDLDLRKGCTIFIAAARYDDNNVNGSSVAQFGIEAVTEKLIWYIVSHLAGRWKVYVLFDDTYYTLKTADFTHTVGNYPQCAPRGSQGPNNIIS